MPVDSSSSDQLLEDTLARERRAAFLVYAAIAADIAGLLWLGVRADSPTWMRTTLDILMAAFVCGAILAATFRYLLLYPFRIQDLFLIVIVLSLASVFVLNQLSKLSAIGLIHTRVADLEHAGEVALALTIIGSILLSGAATGLRTCHRLKIERPFSRAVTLVCAMFSLPASAASIALGILLLLAAVRPGTVEIRPLEVISLWFAALAVTFINIKNYGRMLTLAEVITSREKLTKS